MPDRPPLTKSPEATPEQLQLAKDQGAAFLKAVQHMTQKEAHGAEKTVGDYIVGYAVEDAEGMFMPVNGGFEWTEPNDENCHVEIVVRDGADGRFLPGLKVQATLKDASGNEVGTHEQPFLWHPWLYHYGRNWRVPGNGEYTLSVHIDAPTYPRHDRKNGKRFQQPADVTFEKVSIETGQKR